MKYTNVVYEKKITAEDKPSISQYGNETLRLEGLMGDGDNVDLSILDLMERVHIHLGVELKSSVKDEVISMKAAQIKEQQKQMGATKLTEKDTVPSDPQLERPPKVDEAKEIIEEKREEGKKEKKTTKKKTTKKKEEKPDLKVVEPEVVEAEVVVEPEVVEPEVVEEKKEVPKKDCTPYNREDKTLRKEFSKILAQFLPEWSTTDLAKAKKISSAMNGKDMVLPSGDISKKFVNEIEKLANE